MVDEAITSDSIVDLSKYGRVSLEPRTEYRFRLTAINGCGMGAFGEVRIFPGSKKKTVSKQILIKMCNFSRLGVVI